MTFRSLMFGLLLIAAVTFSLYASSLGLNFLYGDDYTVIKAGYLPPAEYFLGNWVGGRGEGGLYRPIVTLSVAIDRSIWGLSPFGYHLSSLLFQAVSACLVFLICYLLAGDYMLSLAAGLLFSVLPLGAEVVNWICSRCDLLATMFYLISFYLYAMFSKKGIKALFPISIIFFLLSLGSKESALTLPMVLFAYEYMEGRAKERIKALSAYFILLLPYFALRFYSLGTFVGGYKVGMSNAVISMVLGPVKTFQVLFLPFFQENIALYFILMALLVPFSLFGLAMFIKKGKPSSFFYFSLTWAFVALLPTIYILPIGFDLRCSRFWYLPSAGIAWALSYIALGNRRKYSRNGRIISMMLFGAFMLYSAFFLWKVNRDWVTASDITKEIRKNAVRLIERSPKAAKVFFWGTPDNYKGCFIGFPYLERPFYDTDRVIMGYQGNYQFIEDLPAALTQSGAVHYVYDAKTGNYMLKSYAYVSANKMPRLLDNDSNRERFNGFIRGIRGK